jgi:hypothetical protein
VNPDALNSAHPSESTGEIPLRLKRQLAGLVSGLPLSIMLADIAWQHHFSLYTTLCVVLILTPAVFTAWWRSRPDHPARRADSISSDLYEHVESLRRVAIVAHIIVTLGIVILTLNPGHSNWSHAARPLWLMLSLIAYLYLISIANLCGLYREAPGPLSLHLTGVSDPPSSVDWGRQPNSVARKV